MYLWPCATQSRLQANDRAWSGLGCRVTAEAILYLPLQCGATKVWQIDRGGQFRK